MSANSTTSPAENRKNSTAQFAAWIPEQHGVVADAARKEMPELPEETIRFKSARKIKDVLSRLETFSG